MMPVKEHTDGAKNRNASGSVPPMMFVRRFRHLTGGHLKVFDYFNHVAACGLFRPTIYFTPDSVLDDSNPWSAAGSPRADIRAPAAAYFVAGMDWELYDKAGVDLGRHPVVNLVQHVRHAREGDPRNAFLSRPALRICVSREIAEAIRATGRANGEIAIVENGIDLAFVGGFAATTRANDVFVAGLKNPEVARALAEKLARRGLKVDLADKWIPRRDFLLRMARARVALLLPNKTDGFYLPAVEAMATETAVVVPDCIGNRSFCIDGVTCVMPDYTVEVLAAAAADLAADPARIAGLVAAGKEEAARHAIDRERREVQALLETLAGGA